MNKAQQQSTYDDGNIKRNAIITSTPEQKKLGSMVLGDGGFEAMMKGRSKVSTIMYILFMYNIYYILFHMARAMYILYYMYM